MRYALIILKRNIEDLLMLPFIFLGRCLARWKPLGQDYDTFFFFPFYHIGGAEKVHYQVAQATASGRCIMFFTRKSHNRLFYDEFAKAGCTMKDISRYTDNKWLYFNNIIFRGIISGYINRQKQPPLVFNGQCNFAYKLSRWLHKEVPQVELIHSFSSFSYIRLPFIPFYDATVMISRVRIEQHLQQYRRWGVPQRYAGRIRYICNAIPLPAREPAPEQYFSDTLQVLYVGRATAEKRVHLVAQMAQRAAAAQAPLRFAFLGEVKHAIPAALQPYCHMYGNQADPALISDIYRQSAILVLTSDTEGFPMVMMEAMGHGLAVMATPVGDIPLHMEAGAGGALLQPANDEAAIVEQGLGYALAMSRQREVLRQTGLQNREYAKRHFGLEVFEREYRALFERVKEEKKAYRDRG